MFKDFSGPHCTFNLADDGPAQSHCCRWQEEEGLPARLLFWGLLADVDALVLAAAVSWQCYCRCSLFCGVVPCSCLMHLLALPLVVLVMLLLYLTVTYIVVLFGQAIW